MDEDRKQREDQAERQDETELSEQELKGITGGIGDISTTKLSDKASS
jgi:hypothetical protein